MLNSCGIWNGHWNFFIIAGDNRLNEHLSMQCFIKICKEKKTQNTLGTYCIYMNILLPK